MFSLPLLQRIPPISKISLSAGVVVYLFLLNLAAAPNLRDAFFYGVWPALAILILLSAASVFPRLVTRWLAAFLVLIASIAVFFKSKYQIIITDDVMLSAWLNDATLSLEMLSSSLLLWLFFTALLPICAIFIAPLKTAALPRQFVHAALFCALLLACIFGIFDAQGFEMREKGQIRDPKIANSLSYFSPVDAIYSAHIARKKHKAFLKTYANLPQLSKTYRYALSPDAQDLLVVFILGETARGDRFSLNGYARNTNPQLATVENLHSFANVSSCNTITINSIKCIFGRVTEENRFQPVAESAFTDVFRSLGFKTEIYSLQGLNEFYNYLGYDKLVSKYAILKNADASATDQALLPFLKDAIDEKNGKKLVILHTLGSHHNYLDRTTAQSQPFKPFCTDADVRNCSAELLNNAYDNTIVATDSFLHDSIDLLKDRKALVFYVSDHGESLGENNFYYHGAPPDIAPKEQFHIPMLVWLSPALRQTALGQSMEAHLAAQDRAAPLSHANVFHTILGCAGISSSDGGMDSALDLCASRP